MNQRLVWSSTGPIGKPAVSKDAIGMPTAMSLGALERNHPAGAAGLIGGQDNAQVHQTVLG